MEPPVTDPVPPRSRRRLALGAVALLALCLGAFVAYKLDPAPSTPGSPSTSPAVDAQALLALSLPDADGVSQPLAQWKGKLVIVNFWATWCAPCREEMPMFAKAQAEHGAKGLQFVGIAVDDAVKVKKFEQEFGINYPSLIGGYGAMELSKALGNNIMALPFTIAIGRDGRVLLTQLGPVKPGQIEALVKAL